MKHIFLSLVAALLPGGLIFSQTNATAPDSVVLGEAVVKGQRVVHRPDRQVIYPSDVQREAATSGYALLARLPLTGITVNPVNETISAVGVTGQVVVRIDDVDASPTDLAALNPKAVRRVELITSPGVRYGDDVARVVNIITWHATSGYEVGGMGYTPLPSRIYRGGVYARVNHKASELAVDYTGRYADLRGASADETARYVRADGSAFDVTRQTQAAHTRTLDHNVQLRHTLRPSTGGVVQTTFTLGRQRKPKSYDLTAVTNDGRRYTTENDDHSRSLAPRLEVYAQRQWGDCHTVVADVAGALTRTDADYSFTADAAPYAYAVAGRAHDFHSELLYEARLKPFTVTAGATYDQRYVDNAYTGSVGATSQMRSAYIRGYGQVAGTLWGFGYQVGLGWSRQYFRQGTATYDDRAFRPKVAVSRDFGHGFTAAYTFTAAPYVSRMQYVSDVAVQTNELEVQQGNPDLRPANRTEHSLTLTRTWPRFTTQLNGFYRRNAHPVMQLIRRDEAGRYVFTRANQRACDFFNITTYNTLRLIPDRLELTAYATLMRTFNFGDDYTHHFTTFMAGATVNAYLGRLSLTASASSGYRGGEGESRFRQVPDVYLGADYRLGRCSLGLYWLQPLQNNMLTEKVRLLNRDVQKTTVFRNRDYGNVVGLSFTWRLERGRRYDAVNQRLKAGETDTGLVR